MKLWLLFALAIIAGCAGSNLQWSKDNNVYYNLVEPSPSAWLDTLKALGLDSHAEGFYMAPNTIFVKPGQDPWLRSDVLEHEIGHIREYREGLEPHSKYALPIRSFRLGE